ncbi:hypothetical protein BDQ17DRAFT_1368519 [Cyathus striatus]|nr:hypothetical protein BDQ17DRAFT_1368519 [Cyathus striatus]
MQEILLNERFQQFEEIRSTVLGFLNRCGIAYPRNVRVDPAFDEDCHAECLRRGYDLNTLRPFLRVGIDIAGTAYTHLKDKKIPRYIAIYTAFLTFLDDSCQSEEGIVFVSTFLGRFVNNEPQEYKMLDDLASVLKEVNVYWRPITASLILSASLGFISSLFLDHETKDMQLGGTCAINYPSFTRRLSGISDSYVIFAFPPEMPTSHYVQAIPDICDYTNHVNDIMSFYKEELQGEELNYITLVGKTRCLEKLDALKLVSNNTASAHERIMDLLKGEAYTCYKSYSQGYVGFHSLCRRYKLDQLNM